VELPRLGKAELRELEALVVESLDARDDSMLNVLGYGEVSVALGWPVDNPRFACKPTPPFTHAEFGAYQQLVGEYIERVEAGSLDVADTTIVPIERRDMVVSYLVQPMLDSASLGHNVLAASEPDPDHPFLVAVAESLDVVSSKLSIDAQVTNFSWDGSKLTLVDVGTPFLWDDVGTFRFDMAPFVRMLPAPTRPLAVRELTKLVSRWNDRRRVGVDLVANLYREGIPEWVDPAIVALNRKLDSGDAITAAEAREFYDEDVKIWPTLKKAQALERWWQTSVRRRPYDFFIYSSFS
jgi:hypothetical protein